MCTRNAYRESAAVTWNMFISIERCAGGRSMRQR